MMKVKKKNRLKYGLFCFLIVAIELYCLLYMYYKHWCIFVLKFINCNDILKYFLILAIDYTNLTCSNSVNKMCVYFKQIKNSLLNVQVFSWKFSF